jgi:hypothetical protein
MKGCHLVDARERANSSRLVCAEKKFQFAIDWDPIKMYE